MANIHTADSDEASFLREMFGSTVTDVCFWDADAGRGRFEQVVGHDQGGAQLGVVTRSNRKAMAQLRQMAADRAETVKFWLEVPDPVV